MNRDLTGLSAYGREIYANLTLWKHLDDVACRSMRALRRRLDLTEITALIEGLQKGLKEAQTLFDLSRTEKNEHH